MTRRVSESDPMLEAGMSPLGMEITNAKGRASREHTEARED